MSTEYARSLFELCALLLTLGVGVFALRRLGVLRPAAGARRMRVLERAALDARRSIVLVDVAGRWLVLGLGDGAPRLLVELTPEPGLSLGPASSRTFASVWTGATAPRRHDGSIGRRGQPDADTDGAASAEHAAEQGRRS